MSQLEDCVVSCCRSYHPTNKVDKSRLRVCDRLLVRVRGIRQFGGAALDFYYVVLGSIDSTVFQFTDPKLEHPPGCLMVNEAGGKSMDFPGKKWDLEAPNIVEINGNIHSVLLELINPTIPVHRDKFSYK